MRTLAPVLCLLLASFDGHGQQAGSTTCKVGKPVAMDCPAGWTILSESDESVVVGNFRLGPAVTKNTPSGQGRATIAVLNMPGLYDTFSDWIYAAHKEAPDAVENKLNVTNKAGASVAVVLLVLPDRTGITYSSYFFQVGKTPILLALMYRADDPKRDEYTAAAKTMIASAAAPETRL